MLQKFPRGRGFLAADISGCRFLAVSSSTKVEVSRWNQGQSSKTQRDSKGGEAIGINWSFKNLDMIRKSKGRIIATRKIKKKKKLICFNKRREEVRGTREIKRCNKHSRGRNHFSGS